MQIKRITPNKIKLGIHLQNRYRFYNVSSDIVVSFKYLYQANTYYANDVVYIDINTSEIIPHTPTHDENTRKQIAIIQVAFNTYKLLNGKIIDRTTIRNNENEYDFEYILLQNNNNLYTKLQDKINIMRRLHTSHSAIANCNNNAIPYFSVTNTDTIHYVDIYTPRNYIYDRETRPYHINEQNISVDMQWGANIYHYINGTNTTNSIYTTQTNTTNTTTTTPTQNYTRLIAGYHGGRLTPNTMYHSEEETPTHTTRYFGIELETELIDQYKLNEYTHKLNDLINGGTLGKVVKFEEDGSLRNRGCEIITQPMTPKFIIEHREKIKEIMQLINEYATSHDNGRCGMHVHVSRASLTEDAINEIYFVVETFKKELINFSRRTDFNYCAFHNFSTNNISNGYKYIDKDYFIRNKTYGHYTCLNNANNNTLEFRFLRGTTNINTFMASIELIDNICNMVMNNDFKEGTKWLDIINYNDTYDDLKRYNERRNITSTKEYKEILDLSRSDR